MKRISGLILFFFYSCFSPVFCQHDVSEINYRKIYNQAKKLEYVKPDSSLKLFIESKDGFLEQGDTLRAIQSLVKISTLYSTKANYNKSYDGYWEALILANKINDSTLTGSIFDGIAILYGLFYRYEEAEKYYKKAIRLKKEQVEHGHLKKSSLVSTYYYLAIHYREVQNYALAQKYIDSCISYKDGRSSGFINSEQAYLYFHSGNYKRAKQMLLEAEKDFLDGNQTYLVVLYYYLGNVHKAIGNYTQCEMYYMKSVEIAETYFSHKNFVPEVYNKLSELYLELRDYKKAHKYLLKSKQLNDSLFGARSLTNNTLLQIKDDYRVELERQQQFIEEARIKELEQKQRIWFLRNIILIVILVSLTIISLIVFRYLRLRNYNLRQSQIDNEQKNREILEVKNKELTSSALQLIEKDELLKEIKNKLQAYKDKSESLNASSLLNRIKTNSKQDWKEFNARFTDVNESFYKALSQKFPKLTQGELKLCALVKLNFSSKEMAQLLGISIESVHTSRYRLRKKLNLGKGDNLTEFIAKVE